VRAGKLRGLFLFASKRSPGAPEVPTMAEAGGPPIEASTWILFLAPAGTPREIVNRLSQEAAKAVGQADVRERFSQSGIDPVGSTPEQFASVMQKDIERYGALAKQLGIQPL